MQLRLNHHLLILLFALALTAVGCELSPYDRDDKENITDYDHDSRIYRLGMPVAKMLIHWDGTSGRDHFCSGFLVGPDLVMTNYHCAGITDRVAFEFHYERIGGSYTDTYIYSADELLASSPSLDVAIYRTQGYPGRRFGWVRLAATTPYVGEDLILIQHPNLDHKQVSIQGCHVAEVYPNWISHTCDTEDGSSGSPIFLRDGRVVGLHNKGRDDPSDPASYNTGHLMKSIIAWAHTQGVYLTSGPDGSEPTAAAHDYTGDKRADIALAKWVGTGVYDSIVQWDVLKSQGNFFSDDGTFNYNLGNPGEQFITGDFNGDKKDDVLLVRESSDLDIDLWVALSDGSKFNNPQKWRDNVARGHQRYFVGDFNGDRNDDVAYVISAGDTIYGNNLLRWYVFLSTGTSFQDPSIWHYGWGAMAHRFYVGDFTGDEVDDIAMAIAVDREKVSWSVMSPVDSDSSGPYDRFVSLGLFSSDIGNVGDRYYVGDYDGDGDDDILCAHKNPSFDQYQLDVALSTGNSFGAVTCWDQIFGTTLNDRIYVGDYNGDERTDVAVAHDYSQTTVTWEVELSTGSGFTPSDLWCNDFGDAGDIFY